MPWLALPFGDLRIKAIKTHFEVTGIPCLVILNRDGKEVTRDGRNDIYAHKSAVKEKWDKEM